MERKKGNIKEKIPRNPENCELHRKKYLDFKDKIRKAKNNEKPQLKNDLEEIFKTYKKILSKTQAEFAKDLQSKLKLLKNSDPKAYWEIINGAIATEKKEGDICLGRFLDHFEKLSNCKTRSVFDPENLNQNFNEELNVNFTFQEIKKSAKN